jgi:hypothetical protein
MALGSLTMPHILWSKELSPMNIYTLVAPSLLFGQDIYVMSLRTRMDAAASPLIPVGAGEGLCGEGTLASPSSQPSVTLFLPHG